MVEDWIAWVKGFPWKDWSPSIITAGAAVVVGWMTFFAGEVKDRRTRRDVQRKEVREGERQGQIIERQADIATAQEFTARFRALMEGYENRITDLTSEMSMFRGEVRDLRQQLESHQRVCRGCPNFEERYQRLAPRPAT